MRSLASLVCVVFGFCAIPSWAQIASSCTVTPNPNLSVESLELELLGQKTIRIHFQTIAGSATDHCMIASENQSQMVIVCPAEHGRIELIVAGDKSQIHLSAKGRSGREFKASSAMNCR